MSCKNTIQSLTKVLLTAATTLLVLAVQPASAGKFNTFEGTLKIENQTPYSIQVTGQRMEQNKRGSKGTFTFDDLFINSNSTIYSGATTLVGTGSSQENKTEGHLLFTIGETGEEFDFHYRFGKDNDDNTWARINLPQTFAEIQRQEAPKRHPLMNAKMIRTCKKGSGRYHMGTSLKHDCTVTITMDQPLSDCLSNRNCSVPKMLSELKIRQLEQQLELEKQKRREL
ncbi:hypothetical protein [Parendozoicomonas haliclonae]|uniref:Uncharacterized protein n=1 Tax=Parendozoicomonas haliclonae TaxID=1960125 RepID=A0A1X7AQ79_9GAMM|nr:hypothetical protein [Parendozoicomonas haliclonae]SMA49562.1 hypothetical protein EHSB41UT_03349 [Parendozoicomonas haliclonae]